MTCTQLWATLGRRTLRFLGRKRIPAHRTQLNTAEKVQQEVPEVVHTDSKLLNVWLFSTSLLLQIRRCKSTRTERSPGRHLLSLLIFLMSQIRDTGKYLPRQPRFIILPGKEGTVDGSSMKLIKVFLVWWGFTCFVERTQSCPPFLIHCAQFHQPFPALWSLPIRMAEQGRNAGGLWTVTQPRIFRPCTRGGWFLCCCTRTSWTSLHSICVELRTRNLGH